MADERSYHHYTDEERENLAMARMMRLMAKHGEVQAMMTFLAFSFPAISQAAATGDPENVKIALAKVTKDVSDFGDAAQKFINVYGEVIEQLRIEWLDTLTHEESNGNPPAA